VRTEGSRPSGPENVAPPAAPNALVFKGVVLQDDRFYVAYIEDTATLKTTARLLGDPVGHGRIVGISLDALNVDTGGRVNHIALGGVVEGTLPPPPPLAAAPTPSAGPSSAGGTGGGFRGGAGGGFRGQGGGGTGSAGPTGSTAARPSATPPAPSPTANLSSEDIIARMKRKKLEEQGQTAPATPPASPAGSPAASPGSPPAAPPPGPSSQAGESGQAGQEAQADESPEPGQ
jgi:hypothetical protein